MEDRFKFRVYIKYAKMVCYDINSFHIDRLKNKITIRLDNYTRTLKFNDVVLVQCTGLHDKNGKLIYEGDIVEQIGLDGKRTKLIVLFKHCGFVAEHINGNPYNWLSQVGNIEVIGNIYENPDLVTGE